ncbi:hypothetical protein [Methanococcus maripaludis]|uniref:DNA-binding MarR family transcriptional regulator n=2 Tax=Methanococcus maripaludis TaxID=39152 RepID=A0A7J9PJA5_METMI|nr:hypothetical protein [Methanococcus maripaludis]MBA2861609.1 DNA-binding MarR family transcriptional regulator [Methanococcus maripaludis]
MIIETLLILFLFSLFSKGAKNKKEALEIINKDLNALTILSYFKENTKNNVVMSASPGRISEVLNVDLTELEPSFDVLSEKKLVKKIHTGYKNCPIKYEITPFGRTVISEHFRKEKLKNNPNYQKPANRRPKNNGALFDKINENISQDKKEEKPKEIKPKAEEPKKNQNLIKNKFEQDVPINFYSKTNNDENLSFEIGEAFENFVAEQLFPDHHFVLTHMTPNFAMNSKRYCESSLKPDLGFRDKKTGKEFYVECKFRGGLTEDGKYSWTKDKDQANRYRDIQKDENKQVFVAMGLGGMSNNPRNIFLVPLDEIKYLELYPSVLRNWEVYNVYDIFKIVNS